MKKHFFKLVATLSLICGVFAFTCCTDYEEDINAINDRLDQLETGRIADVESQLESLQEAIESAQGAIDAINSLGLEDMKTQLGNLVDQVDDINVTIGDLENQLGDLSGQVGGIASDLGSLGDRVDGLEGDYNDLAGQIGNLEDLVDSYIESIEAVEGQVKNLEGQIADIEAKFADYATLDYVDGTFATKDAVDSLNTSLGALETLVETMGTRIGNLDTRIEGLENLYDVDLKASEIVKMLNEADSIASLALGNISSLIDALGVYAEKGAIDAALEEKLDISEFQSKFDEALRAALENGGMVDQAIASAIDEAVEKISKLFSGRLTSISLIPDLYLNGVPAIGFNSYVYYEKTLNVTKEGETYTSATDLFRIPGKATDVNYHISPSYISKSDIDFPSYTIKEAQNLTKAQIDPEFDLEIVSYSIEDDVLTATVRRSSNDQSLVHKMASDGYMYTAALRVPIAAKNLVEGETEANVYSEYSALWETEVTPYIAAVIDESKSQEEYIDDDPKSDPNHFSATFNDAKNAGIAIKAEYNEPLDLLQMVTGCTQAIGNTGHKEITKATLRENGLAFRFAVPTPEYNAGENNANQQSYAKMDKEDGHYLYSTGYGVPDGTFNQSAIGKTPIVRVELRDTVNDDKIVDIRYFKIQWTPETLVKEDQDLKVIAQFNYDLSCDDFEDVVDWATFQEKVLSQVNNGQGLSYDDFIQIYGVNAIPDENVKITFSKGKVITPNDNVIVNWDIDNPDQHAAAITWTLTPAQIGSLIDGKHVDELNKGDVLETITMDVTLEAKDDYNANIKFQVEVNILTPVLPKMVGNIAGDWVTLGELARIRPVQLQYDSKSAQTFVTYDYDLSTLFRTNDEGVMINNAMPLTTGEDAVKAEMACRAWSFQFSEDQATDYLAGFDVPTMYNLPYSNEEDNTADAGRGYKLYQTVREADLASYFRHDGQESKIDWYQEAVEKMTLHLSGEEWFNDGTQHYRGTDAAINLLEPIDAEAYTKFVTINAWGRINAYNHVIAREFDVVFIKPIYVAQSDEDLFFTDGIEGGSKISIADIFTAHDSWDYPVSIYADGKNADADARNDYYDVQEPVYDLTNARIGMVENADGDLVPVENASSLTDADVDKLPKVSEFPISIALTLENGQLVFKAENGWNLEEVIYVYVEVSIDHKWGTESMWLHLPVKPHDTSTSQN